MTGKPGAAAEPLCAALGAMEGPRDPPTSPRTWLGGAKQDGARQLVLVTLLICGMELCEQLASETFNGTQIFFMGNLKMDTKLNDGMTFARDRVFMVFLLLGAKLGDHGLGRFRTVTLGAVIYFIGNVMVLLATDPWISRLVWYLLGAFLVIPFSQAAIQANLSNFGADQFNPSISGHAVKQDQFFWWFNVALHSGILLAVMLLSCYGISEGAVHYLSNEDWLTPLGSAEPQEYYTVFITAAAAFLFAIVLFIWGQDYYSEKSRRQLPGSPIVGVTQWLVKITGGCSLQGAAILTAKVLGITIYISQAALFWCPDLRAPLSIASAIGVVFSVGGIILFCQDLSWMDGMEQPHNQPLALEDVKCFLRLLPLIVCTQIAYGCLFMMMKTWYVRQTCQMDLRLGVPFSGHLDLDAPQMFTAFFSIFNSATVILGTPLVLFYVNPRLERLCQRVGWHFHAWMRYLIGLGFGILSTLFAAHYEVCRRASPVLNLTSNCAPHGVGVRAMSAYWMLVPYMLMGISTLFVLPTLMSISYTQVPKTVRSLTVVTNVFMVSASESVVMALSVSMREYTPHDLDTGNLEYLYFMGIAMSLFLLAIFASIVPFFEDRVMHAAAAEALPAVPAA